MAAATFPLACPPTSPPEDVAAFIAANLSRRRFADYLADPARTVLTAREDGRILGYAILLFGGVGADADVARAVTTRPAAELSKIYVLAGRHGAGVAARLMNAANRCAAEAGAQCLWLGVNQKNTRAQRFYRKNGLQRGRHQDVSAGHTHTEHDFATAPLPLSPT